MKRRYELSFLYAGRIHFAVCWDRTIDSAFERLVCEPVSGFVQTKSDTGNTFFTRGDEKYCINSEVEIPSVVIEKPSIHPSELAQKSKPTTTTDDILRGLL
jgi:hypothetical protein